MMTDSAAFCPLVSGSSGNAAYISSGRTRLLIDAGVSCAELERHLRAIGESPGDLNGILITHEHSDHIRGARVLARKYHLPIFASFGTWDAMMGSFSGVESRDMRAFEPGGDFFIGDICVTPFDIPHDAAQPVGYALSFGASRVAVATDIGGLKHPWLKAVEGADTLLIEANHDVDMLKDGAYPYHLKKRILSKYGHLSNDDCAGALIQLVKSGAKRVMLGHLSGSNNLPELAYACVSNRLIDAGVTLNEDVMLSVAPRSAPGQVVKV